MLSRLTERLSPASAVMWRELVRLARRGQVVQNRILLLYFLFLATVLFAVAWAAPGSPIRGFRSGSSSTSRAAIVELLTLVLFEAQLLFGTLLAPASAAIAIASEKDQGTLSLLQTTQLSDADIVWGKAAARVSAVLFAILAGVPILVILDAVSPIPSRVAAAGYALIFGTTVLGGALGARAGCVCPDSRSAVLRANFHAAVFLGGLPVQMALSPFAILAYATGVRAPGGVSFGTTPSQLGLGFAYASMQAAVGVLVIGRATRLLRTHTPSAGPPEPTAFPEPPRGRPTPVVLDDVAGPRTGYPPLDSASPMLWKERHAARTQPFPILDTPIRWLGAIVAAIAVTLFAVGAWQVLARAVLGLDPDLADHYSQPVRQPSVGGGWLLTAGVLSAGLFLLPLAVGVSGCVASERQRGTLDSLLGTPLPRWTILRSKVQAHVEKWLVFGVGSLTAIGCSFGAGGGVRVGLAAVASTGAGFWFVTACAAWLSVRCLSPDQAMRLCLGPVTVVLTLPPIAWSYADWTDPAAMASALGWAAVGLAIAAGVVWWRAVAGLSGR